MKKLLIMFSICAMAVSTVFGQDDVYYNDQNDIEAKAPTAPPEIPDYVQPPCPGDGYLWTPGYWAWAPAGYYWVPGVWVYPPHVGLLWTPGYWGFYGGFYGWHRGYWGPHIGFYGGVNYGFGYYGSGFYGGRWEGGVFRYNAAVWHVDGGVHNFYREEYRNAGGSRASFNGPGGVRGRPNVNEMSAIHENHVQPTSRQISHHQSAGNDRGQFVTGGARPGTSAMNKINGQHFNHEGHPAPSFHGGGARGGGGGNRGGGSRGGGGGHR